MGGVEPFVILPVTALYFTVVSGRIWPDQLVPDAVAFQIYLKERWLVSMGGKAVGELCSVVRLDAFYGTGERFHQMLQKHGRRIGAVFFKSLYKAPPGIFVNSGILEKMFSNDLAVDKAGRGDKLHIHLNTLSGMVHLLIGFRDILRIRRMDRHNALLFKEAVQSGNGAGITTLHELDPEDNKAGIRIASAHIRNELNLIRSMLIGMMMGPSGEIPQGFNGAIKAALPAVNVLPVGFVFNSGFGNPIFVSIFNK